MGAILLPKIINFPEGQGSAVWKNWRKKRLGASDAAAVLGESPYDTPESLWKNKTGRTPDKEMTWAMQQGHFYEPIARKAWERMVGHIAEPICVEHRTISVLSASLDGITPDWRTLLEIKVPNVDDHALAVAGKVPRKYWIQMQHQSNCVPSAEELHYFSYRPESGGVLVVIKPDRAFQAYLQQRELEFWECVANNTNPAGSTWEAAARRFMEASAMAKEAEANKEAALETLRELMPDGAKAHEGFGVRLSRFIRKGAVDYDSLFRQLGIEVNDELLDAHRKPPSLNWRGDVQTQQAPTQ